MASIVSKQHTLKANIIGTLKQCGLRDGDFEVIQKMDYDVQCMPVNPNRTICGPIMINVLNLQAVLDHAEEIGKVYRVNILTLNEQPVHAAIQHEVEADYPRGVYRKEM